MGRGYWSRRAPARRDSRALTVNCDSRRLSSPAVLRSKPRFALVELRAVARTQPNGADQFRRLNRRFGHLFFAAHPPAPRMLAPMLR
jgi:hypothetical protein